MLAKTKTCIHFAMALGCSLGILTACGSLPTGIVIYSASDIDNRQVHFIWLELPEDLVLGSNDMRVFMARTEPAGLLVPTNIELPCIIGTDEEYCEFRPLTLPFEYDGEQLVGSYAWEACASCVECYMNWTTTMEIVGTLDEGTMSLSIGIRHMGHNIQEDYLSVELLRENPGTREPGIRCRSTSECLDLEFLPRE